MKPAMTLISLVLAAGLPSLSVAVDSAPPFSALRPGTDSKIEAAPTDLDQSLLVEAAAEVVHVDYKSRMIGLKLADGSLATIRVGKEVTNLDRIKAGDLIEVTYYEGKDVAILPPGAAKPGTSSEVLQGKDAPVPGVVSQQIVKTVEILDVDLYKGTVSFRGQDNRVREMSLHGTDLEHYLSEVRKGDTVQVSFVQAVALTLRPATR
jgi:hypothetical protein